MKNKIWEECHIKAAEHFIGKPGNKWSYNDIIQLAAELYAIQFAYSLGGLNLKYIEESHHNFKKSDTNMSWPVLRKKLRDKFGSTGFSFYNDLRKSGARRIKIACMSPNRNTVKQFILKQDPTLDVKEYGSYELTIHYKA